MVQRVRLPNGGFGNFPDDMSREEIQAVLQRQFPPGTPVVKPQDQSQPQDSGARGFLSNLADEAVGLIDTGASLGVGFAGEVASGFGGLAKSITSGSEAGGETQKQIQQAITFPPRSAKGRRNIEAVGGFLSPVLEGLEAARDFLGDIAFKVTGSPAMATAFSILPDAALEILGAGIFLRTGKSASKLGKVRKEAKKLKAKEALAVNKGFLIKSAPTPKKIFELSSKIYDEVDGFGATLRKFDYNKFADDMSTLRTQLDIQLNPEISRILDIIDEGRVKTLTVGQVDNIRKKTVTALSKSSKAGTDKFAARKIQGAIDELLDNIDSINVPKGVNPADVSLRLRSARKLWARGKRAQLIDEAIKKADVTDNPLQTLKTSFIKILKDDVVNKQFTLAEKTALKDFIKPGGGVNILRLAGNFGFDFDRPGSLGNMFALASGGTAAGSGILGPGTTVAVAVAGTVSKSLAKKILEKRSSFANALFAAGRDGPNITKAYLHNIKKSQRSPSDLGQLLLEADPASFSKLPKTDFVREALAVVESRRRALALAVPAPALGLGSNQDQAR